MPDDIAYHYIPFAAKSDDEARIVEGYVSSGDLDCDAQIVDQEWLKAALPSWLSSWGNIREMHAPRAVGKAQSVDLTTLPGPYLAAKIVDDDAWKKVKAGVYNGFSVGIKGPKIVYDGTAKNGRIAGGNLIEISIVDRPANDAAKFVVLKRAGANEWKLGEGGPVVEDLAKAATADSVKRAFDAAARARLADAGAARPDGSYPIERPADVANAIRDFGRAKGSAADQAHIVARAKALGATDHLPADWPGSTATAKEKSLETETSPATPDAEKAAASHVEHKHPYKGTHNHEHDDLRGGTHTHAHLHDDDDMHDHPHLGGKDARMLSPEERDTAVNLKRNSDNGLYFAADADTHAPVADAAKAVAGFQEAAPPAPSRPAAIGDVSAILKDALQRIEALAGQTDSDRDGDIDTPANMEADGPGAAGAAPAEQVAVQRPAPATITPETLSLTFASEADLFKAIDARIAERTAAEFITKAAIAEPLATIPDIAKLAGGLAKGLEALATKAETGAKELDAMKAALAETQADLARVKELAQPVKGAVFAVDKGIGIEPDRIYRDGVIPESAKRGAEAARVLAGLSDNERREVGAAVLAEMYRARQ